MQFIHAEVTRVFFTFPSGRGLVQTRIPSVISIRVVISLGVGFSLKMKIICFFFFIENILEQNKKKKPNKMGHGQQILNKMRVGLSQNE